MNPNNALRDAEGYPMKAHERLEALKKKLSKRESVSQLREFFYDPGLEYRVSQMVIFINYPLFVQISEVN